MLLTLNVSSIRSLIAPSRGKPKLRLTDVPRYTAEELGLSGLVMTTDLLAGATRDSLATLRDRGDKSGCAVLALIETDAQPIAQLSGDAADKAADRLVRVIEAASLLGCNSAAASIQAPDTDEAMERAAEALKPVVERAERREINFLLAPGKGLTADPDRVTALVKQVGGFRIGTMPDFQAAVDSGDPEGYLKRLTPYASVVIASTLEFTEPEPEPRPEPAKAKAEAAEGADEGSQTDADTSSEGEGDDEGDLRGGGAEALLAAISGLSVGDAEAAAIDAELEQMFDDAPPIHVPYDLAPLLGAVQAVGYDGSLAIDFRGRGDGTLGVHQSRDAIEAAFEALAEGKGK